MSKLNPRQAGGIEPVEPRPYATTSALDSTTLSDLDPASSSDEEDEEMQAGPSTLPQVKVVQEKKLQKGQGRIIRDENGKIIKIVMGGEGEDGGDAIEDVKERVEGDSEEDDDEEDSDEEGDDEEVAAMMYNKKPWGEAMEVWEGEGSDEGELMEEDLAEWTKPRKVGQGIAVGPALKRQKIIAKTDVVKGLSSVAPSSNPLAHVVELQNWNIYQRWRPR